VPVDDVQAIHVYNSLEDARKAYARQQEEKEKADK
jgi:hypothetical protein